MRFDLIALDLDDTLLHRDLSISEANRLALRKAHGGGAKIVLASGRNIHSMGKYARLLGVAGPDDYIIATNGAEIVETATGRVLAETRMDGGLCLEVAAAIEDRGFPWQIYVGGKILFHGENPWTDLDSKLSGLPNEAVADVKAALSPGQLKFVVPGDPERIPSLRLELLDLFAGRVEIITSKPYFMEILAAGADKGSALVHLASLLGIGIERCLAMGDAMNDLGMLEAAGFSCAPANALPAAKAAASWVSALTNDEDFVADALARWLPADAPVPR
jgi:Cof subfamily protein (haloacid dehalogenase superfamily)